MHPQPRPFTVQLLLDFCEICFPEWPLNFFVLHDSPHNLAESRYPRGSKGYAEIFSPTQMPKPPGGPGGPTHPPPTPCEKHVFSKLGAKIQMCGAKNQIFSAKTQICGAKIQIFDPKFTSINFYTTINLLFCTRKSPNPANLSPTHPPLGVSKN